MEPMQPAQPAQAAPQAQPAQALPAPNPETMSPIVLAHMDELEAMRNLLDGQMGDAYDRVLTAGMKMMYSKENAEMMKQIITDEAVPLANKLGEGTANLLVMMDNQGNGTIPKEVLVPVGVSLMFEAADYLFELGIDVTEKDLGDGLELMITGVLVGYGVDPKMMDDIINDMGVKLGFDESKMPEAKMEGESEAEEAAEPTEDEAFEKAFEAEQAAKEGM